MGSLAYRRSCYTVAVTMDSLIAVFNALTSRKVRFIVVGGVAVNVQGYQRPTADLDLVVELKDRNVVRALDALESLGYRPVLPVAARDFADRTMRQRWRRERGLEVFSMISDVHRDLTVDLFAFHPFDFEIAWNAATVSGSSLPTAPVRFAAPETLIAMKRTVGRAKDIDDAENLELLGDEQKRRDADVE